MVANAIPERIGTPLAEGIARGIAPFLPGRRHLVARNLQRATGGRLEGRALQRAVSNTFASSGRYWLELFRLPRDARVSVEPRFRADGWEHIEQGIAAGAGVILALPHLGGFDFAATWLAGRGGGADRRRRASGDRSGSSMVCDGAEGDRHGGRPTRPRSGSGGAAR
jgi:KDO2-lipid IV(A) lauroyltransferase